MSGGLGHRVRMAAEGAVAHLAFALFRALPLDRASGVGGFLFRAIGPRLGVSRLARRNLAQAFPGKTPAEVDALLRGVWDNLGRTLGELPHLDAIVADRVEVVGAEVLLGLRDDGRPGLFFSAHLANWEIAVYVAGRLGLKLHLFYRAANNPWTESLYRRVRGDAAAGLLPKGSRGARRALDLLGRGEHIGLLADQKMNDGIAVPFFGRPAMTAPALAQFALRFDCPVVPARVERLGGARFRLTIQPPLEIQKSGDRQADVLAAMTEVNRIIEGWVRDRPDQWLWLHRRWPD